MSFKFFGCTYNPTGLTGTVGGSISSVELSGYLGELFYHQRAYSSDTTGTVIQYRKFYVKNTYSTTSDDTRLWFDAQHVSGQMAVALETGSPLTGNVLDGPSGLSGWSAPTSYSGGFRLGDIATNGYTGIWMRQTLTQIDESVPYVSLRVYVGGVVD